MASTQSAPLREEERFAQALHRTALTRPARGVQIAHVATPGHGTVRRPVSGVARVASIMELFEDTIAHLERSLNVAHVATSGLEVAHWNQRISEIRPWASERAFNNVPVRADDRIVGVVENINGDLAASPDGVPPEAPADADRVSAVARRLSSDMLIEGRLPLGEVLDELLKPPHYRLVIDGGRLDAIVTPSDLGKLPMRVLAYTAVAHLESTMMDAIRHVYPSDEDAVAHLCDGAQTQILRDLRRMHAKNLDPELLEVANLQQKGLILAAAGVFEARELTVADEFAELYDGLRNPLMHAASFVDDSLEALMRLKRHFAVIRQRTAEAAAQV